MPYEVVENFAAGLDTRKNPVSAPAGTLTILKNAMISPGGEIAKARAFVKLVDVPNTFGLAATEASLFIFGKNIDPAVPAIGVSGVTLRGAKIANADPTLAQTDFDVFDGQVYLACSTAAAVDPAPVKTAAQRNPHYYLGPRQSTDPNPSIYEAIETEGSGKGYFVRTFQTKMYSVVGKYLYFSAIGNPFAWDAETYIDRATAVAIGPVKTASTTDVEPIRVYVPTTEISRFVTGNRAYIQGVSATGIKQINDTYQVIGTIRNPDTSNSVGSGYASFELSGTNGATATGPQITGKMYATPAIRITSISNTNPARCTVAAADIGKFIDGQKVLINGVSGGIVPSDRLYIISDVNNPVNTFTLNGLDADGFTTAQSADTWATLTTDVLRTGQGFINISTTDAASESLRSLEIYYDKLAIFSTMATQIWSVDPDPSLNQFEQLLRGSGTRAARSPLQYGSGDVLFLDSSGIRSLKAKDSSNSAAVSDIGSPVDPTIREMLIGNSEKIPPVAALGQVYLDGAVSLLEPSIGRFWMIFKTKILCLSYFPGPDITAWSVLDLPFNMQHAVTCGGRIFFRDDDDGIWIYGGANGTTYNDNNVEVRLPYMSGKKPGHNKTYEALDITATGTWEAYVSYDFNNPNAEELVGTFGPVSPATSTSASTWNGGKMELQGYGSHISLRFYNNDAKNCTLSNIGVHYQMADDEQ
jgi:hypothetical protein